MGLDSFLKGKKYLSNYDAQDAEKIEAIQKLFPELKENQKPCYVEVELAYWRKANAIHKWFVDNVQDGIDECQESWVGLNTLRKLRADILTVLADPNQAKDVLPTQSGFFFGDTEYGEGYIADLEYTEEILNNILDDERFADWEFYYLFVGNIWKFS